MSNPFFVFHPVYTVDTRKESGLISEMCATARNFWCAKKASVRPRQSGRSLGQRSDGREGRGWAEIKGQTICGWSGSRSYHPSGRSAAIRLALEWGRTANYRDQRADYRPQTTEIRDQTTNYILPLFLVLVEFRSARPVFVPAVPSFFFLQQQAPIRQLGSEIKLHATEFKDQRSSYTWVQEIRLESHEGANKSMRSTYRTPWRPTLDTTRRFDRAPSSERYENEKRREMNLLCPYCTRAIVLICRFSH